MGMKQFLKKLTGEPAKTSSAPKKAKPKSAASKKAEKDKKVAIAEAAEDAIDTSEENSVLDDNKYVIWPRVKYPRYPKRMFNYLLEQKDGAPVRRWLIEQRLYDTTGRFPDLDNPKGFNEKLQWMRLHYHDPLMLKCVDKITFKDYIAETCGEEYVVPMLGKWKSANEIDFDSLPDSFAIKSNWGWGDQQNVLVLDKKHLDVHRLKALVSNWLMEWNNYYFQAFEWDSKDIEPYVFAEELLLPASGEIVDYKFYCYNGECKHFLVCKDRKTKTKYINYDLDFNCLALSERSYIDENKYQPDENFYKMLEMANKLSKPFPLVRVDFYDVDGRIYVGELTFSPGGGLNTYSEEWDLRLGAMLTLPEANVEE